MTLTSVNDIDNYIRDKNSMKQYHKVGKYILCTLIHRNQNCLIKCLQCEN